MKVSRSSLSCFVLTFSSSFLAFFSKSWAFFQSSISLFAWFLFFTVYKISALFVFKASCILRVSAFSISDFYFLNSTSFSVIKALKASFSSSIVSFSVVFSVISFNLSWYSEVINSIADFLYSWSSTFSCFAISYNLLRFSRFFSYCSIFYFSFSRFSSSSFSSSSCLSQSILISSKILVAAAT